MTIEMSNYLCLYLMNLSSLRADICRNGPNNSRSGEGARGGELISISLYCSDSDLHFDVF